MAIACLLLFTPGSAVPSGPPGADKVVHFLIFGMLAVSSRYARIGERFTLAWVLAFAACSEVIQALWVRNAHGTLVVAEDSSCAPAAVGFGMTVVTLPV